MVGIETSGQGVLLTFVSVRVFPQGGFLQDRAGSQIRIRICFTAMKEVLAGTRIVLVDLELKQNYLPQ